MRWHSLFPVVRSYPGIRRRETQITSRRGRERLPSDYREIAIDLVRSHIQPTGLLRSIEPDVTTAKLFQENEWSALDNKSWCGDGCWMVWCEIKLSDTQKNIGPIAGYWEVNVKTKTIKVVDGTATPKFFTTTN